MMSDVLSCYHLLELNVISAQDLAPIGRSMRTYAMEPMEPTRVDSNNGTNPAWNEKFVFRVDEDILNNDESVINIDIYCLHWFRDIHVGTAHVLSRDLFLLSSQPQSKRNANKSTGLRFMGLQVQRPSGSQKGILNIGAAITDSSMRSMPLYTHNSPVAGYNQDNNNQPSHHAPKLKLRRIKSDCSSKLDSEAVASEQKAKTKNGKLFSRITPSEASTKISKRKASSTLSGSYVKATLKKGKLRKKTKIKSRDSPNNFNERVNVYHQIKPKPRRKFQNSTAIAMTLNNNHNDYNSGSVKVTPLHAYAMTNAALEYGTPSRSNFGQRLMMTNSELGPSASEVAALIARQPLELEEGENSTVGGWSLEDTEEELQPKVEMWPTELPPLYDGGERSNLATSCKKGKHSRNRQTQGGVGLFSCFSVICGVECSIVCGSGGGQKSRHRRVHKSMDNGSFL